MTARKLPTEDISGPGVWHGIDMAKQAQTWIHTLDVDTIAELEHAARYFLSQGRDLGEISAADFPLGPFAQHLRELRHTLLHGCGFEVLRGLPLGEYSQEFVATVFCGIGAHLGSLRSQNAQGHMLGHVRDIGADDNDPNTRTYQTAERQHFHTDSTDVVGLLSLREAKSGGDSLLVSALAIFNRMRAQRPDLLELLFDPIATDRRGEVPVGAKPFVEIPPLSWFENRLTVFYNRRYIESAQRFPEAMRLSEKHRQALDMFDTLANDPEVHLSMHLQPGDMQFVYNHTQLHDRTSFVDWRNPDARRHLLRLWLSVPADRALPEYFSQRYGSIEIGNRGGIITENTRLHAPLDA